MKRLALIPLVIGAAAVALFVMVVLKPSTRGTEFASVCCFLMLAAAAGPFLYRRDPRAAALRCGALGVFAGVVTAVLSVTTSAGPIVVPFLAGAFCGLYAFAVGALGSLGGDLCRLAAATLGFVLLATLHVWDDVALLDATDRKGSARLAFALNPAAAASVTLDYDWIHATELYRDNETAESLAGVPRAGLGLYALKVAAVALVAAALGWWRRR